MSHKLIGITAAASIVLAAVAPVGCAGGSSAPPVDTTTYCGKAAVVYCANMMACCTGEQRAAKVGEENVNDMAWCQHDMATSCEISMANTLWAKEKGTVSYDESKATSCIDAMKKPEKACYAVADTAPWTDACKDPAFTGTVAADGECHWTFECQKGSTCDGGKCKAPPAENEKCSSTCAEGLYCKASKCVKLLASGAVCTSTYECEANLYCGLPTATATEKKCQALKAQGDACTADSECDSGDCGSGACSTDGSSCTSDLSCDGTCKKGGDTCYSDWSCSSYCEKSGKECYSDSECDTATSEQCVDDTCETGKCNGRVCAAKPLKTYDYCSME